MNFKKTISWIVAILVTCTLFSSGVFTASAAGADVAITLGQVQAAPGDTVVVNLSIVGNGIAGIQADFDYDTAALELTEIEDTGVLAGGILFRNVIANGDNKDNFIYARFGGSINANGVALRCTFRVKNTANGVYTIGLKEIAAFDVLVSPLSVEVSPGSISTSSVPSPVTGVTLSQETMTLKVDGLPAALIETVAPPNAGNKTVTWSSSDPGVANVMNGIVIPVSKGTATITVTTVDGGKTAACAVTVEQPVTGVTLNQETMTLKVGIPGTLVATVAPSNANNQAVTWESNNPAIASVVNGVVTAVSKGTTAITVTTADGGKTAICIVTVEQPVTGVTLNQETMTLKVGIPGTLAATVAPSNANNQAVTWSSSDSLVATVTNGMILPLKRGTTTITVTTVDGGHTATCVVTVEQAVTGVTLDRSTLSLNVGGATETLIATVNPSDANNKAVTWSTSDPLVATVANGVVTPVGKGTATITVTTVDGGKVATCAVEVKQAVDKTELSRLIDQAEALNRSLYTSDSLDSLDSVLSFAKGVESKTDASQGEVDEAVESLRYVLDNLVFAETLPTSIAVTPISVSIDINGTAQLSAVVKPDNATNKTVTWTSSASSIASVNATTGLVKGIKEGTATITASTTNGKTATCVVTVKKKKIDVTSITLNATAKDLITGGATFKLTATVKPDNATNKTITWKSGTPAVATVANGVVTPKAPGKTVITATADGKTVQCTITVHSYVSMRIGYTKAIQNGKPTTIDSVGTKPFKISGKTMIPLRFIGEKMGGKVNYIDDKQPITMTYGNRSVEFRLNSKTIKITENGKSRNETIDVAAQKVNKKTYIPLRAISQALGFTVYYEANGEYIIVNNPEMSVGVRNERLTEAKGYIK